MPVFVKGYARAGRVVKGYARKTRGQRITSLMNRYQRASVTMNKLPGPSTGVYGSGNTRLDKAYTRASNTMKRGMRVIDHPKYRKKALAALATAKKKFPY